jgi:hypothetical protein
MSSPKIVHDDIEQTRKYERERKAEWRLKQKKLKEAQKAQELANKPKQKISTIKINGVSIERPVIKKSTHIYEDTSIKPLLTVKLAESTINSYLSSLRVIVRLYDIDVVFIVLTNVKLMLEQEKYDNKMLVKYFKFIENDPSLLLTKIRAYDKSCSNLIKFVAVLSSRINMKNTYALFSKNNIDEIIKYKKQRDDNFLNDDDIIIDMAPNTYQDNVKKLINSNDILVYSLYRLLPPRRLDYSKMIIHYNDDIDNNTKNIINIKNKTFIFNKYKTSKTYKKQIININDELFNIIIEWIKENNNPKSFPLIDTKTINKVFKQTNGIDNISVDIIRHSYLAYLNDSHLVNKMSETERKEIARLMAHSREEQNIYIKV